MATRRKLSDEQIITVMKQLEAGRTAAEMAREVGVSTYTIYAWKAKYGGMEPSEAIKLRHLEDENSRRVTRALDGVIFERGRPESITLDNGTELTGKFREGCGSGSKIPLESGRERRE